MQCCVSCHTNFIFRGRLFVSTAVRFLLYQVLTCGKETYKTEIIDKTLNPVWTKNSFQFGGAKQDLETQVRLLTDGTHSSGSRQRVVHPYVRVCRRPGSQSLSTTTISLGKTSSAPWLCRLTSCGRAVAYH